jgi:hypothetical protein
LSEFGISSTDVFAEYQRVLSERFGPGHELALRPQASVRDILTIVIEETLTMGTRDQIHSLDRLAEPARRCRAALGDSFTGALRAFEGSR